MWVFSFHDIYIKIETMSIEKIKERIRMIESNDFTLNGELINEMVTGSPDELETLFTKADNSSVKAIALGDDSIDKVNTEYDKWLGGERIGSDNSNNVANNAKPENIPQKDEKVVFGIYREMLNKNQLPSDLDKSKFKPIHGYFRSQTGVSLILFKEKLIKLTYSDAKLTNLKSMNITRGKNIKNNDFVDLFNEFTANKSKYKISKISMVNKGTTISIKF
jgi:hypothetical protein